MNPKEGDAGFDAVRSAAFGSPLRTPHDSPHLFGRSDSVGLPPLREETGGEEKQCKK